MEEAAKFVPKTSFSAAASATAELVFFSAEATVAKMMSLEEAEAAVDTLVIEEVSEGNVDALFWLNVCVCVVLSFSLNSPGLLVVGSSNVGEVSEGGDEDSILVEVSFRSLRMMPSSPPPGADS